MELPDTHTSVGSLFRQSLHQYMLEAENTDWAVVSLLDMFPRNLLQLALLHTVPAQSLGLTQVKALVFQRVFVVPQMQQIAQQSVLIPALSIGFGKLAFMHFQNRHRKRLYPLPTGSKNCCSGTGGSTYQGFFSSRRSGTTFTKAMYRNPPEVKGRIQATVSPAQIWKALVITETEPWETTQTGKKIHKDDKHCLPPVLTDVSGNLTCSFW